MLRSAVQAGNCIGKRLLTSPREAALINLEQVRTTVIVDRIHPPRLAPKGYLPKVRQKNCVLKVVDLVHGQKATPITCILTDFVKGIGIRGDTVKVKKSLFRSELYPAGLAVYASPENLKKYSREKTDRSNEEDDRLGVYAKMTLTQLSGMNLRVYMSGDNPWVLTAKHVRVALRKSSVEAKEECILLPEEPITGPQEFSFTITINGAKSVLVKARILLRYRDPSKQEVLSLPPVWSRSSELDDEKRAEDADDSS